METQNQEEERRCVEINKCPSMYSLFNSQSLTSLTVEFLKRSKCDFDESNQLLCCVEPAAQVSDTPTDDEYFSGSLYIKTHPKTGLLPLESCGLDINRIWEGSVTKLDEFPWLALLDLDKEIDDYFYGCGGVLISKRYVLSVAHCIMESYIFTAVRLGEHNRYSNPDCEIDVFSGRRQCAPPTQDFGVEEVIVYPKYDPLRYCHDIALIRLDRDAALDTKYVKPICLPMDDVEIGQELVLAGWGASWPDFKEHKIKVKSEMPVASLEQCVQGQTEVWCDFNLCTNGTYGKGASTGDSGMPLMHWTNSINGKRRYSVAGLVTSGIDKPNLHITFYTNVFKYIPWILESIRP